MHKISDRIYFTETPDKFTLVISNGLPRILKYIFVVQSICILIGMFAYVVSSFSVNDSVSYVYGILYVFMSIAYLKRAFRKEIVEVTRTVFSIQKKTLFVNKIHSYLISDISHFKFIGENKFTPHALQVYNFDYLGTQTAEIQLQDVIKDGTLEFFCKGERIRFGMDVLSWDAEEIIFRIQQFAGNNLQMGDAMGELLEELNNDENQAEE